MAWRCLPSILFNGDAYSLPLLSQTDIDWLASQGAISQYKTTTLLSDNGASFPFKATTSQYNSGTKSDNLFRFDYNWNSGFLTYYVKNAGGANILSITAQRYNTVYSGIIVDDDTQKAMIFRFFESENRLYSCAYGSNQNLLDAYTAIMGAIPVLYNWSSVPTISGKNGILSLSTIKSAYINDGEPVTGATASNFDALTEETNVGTLVNDTSVDESKVVVRYNIPDGTYQYIKLVYKPNSEPETVSDGVVINIPQVDSQVVIDDIITTGTYYFKIFTNAGNSNTVVLNYVGIVPIIINIERVW